MVQCHMPKIQCPCGFVHDLSPVPDAGWITVRDQDYDGLLAAEIKRAAVGRVDSAGAGGGLDRLINGLHGLLYECPMCHRLLWQRPGQKEWTCYARE